MRNLFLTVLVILLTSFQFRQDPPVYHIGTMNFYQTMDGYFYIKYSGDYPVCFMKGLVGRLFECDSFNMELYLEQLYSPDTLEIDSTNLDKLEIERI